MTELSSVLKQLSEPRNYDLTLLLGDEYHVIHVEARNNDPSRFLTKVDSGDLEQQLDLLREIGADFEEVRIISDTPEVTLVPDGLYESAKSETYLNVCFGPERGRAVQTNHLNALSLQSVIGLPMTMLEMLGDVFPQATFLHLRDVLIMSAWSRLSHEAGLDFSAHLKDQKLELVVFEGKTLIQSTQYTIGDPTDVVYHCLNAMESHAAEYKSVALNCSGALNIDSEAYKLLKAYCPLSSYHPAKGFNKDQEQFFVLAQQHLCAL